MLETKYVLFSVNNRETVCTANDIDIAAVAFRAVVDKYHGEEFKVMVSVETFEELSSAVLDSPASKEKSDES